MQTRTQQEMRADGRGRKLQQGMQQLQQEMEQQRRQGKPAWQQHDEQPSPRMPLKLHEQRIAYNPHEAAAHMEWQEQDGDGGVMEQEHEALHQSRPPLLSCHSAAGRVSQPAPLLSSNAHPQPTTKPPRFTNPQQPQTRRLKPNQGLLSASLSARFDDGLSSALHLMKGQSAGTDIDIETRATQARSSLLCPVYAPFLQMQRSPPMEQRQSVPIVDVRSTWPSSSSNMRKAEQQVRPFEHALRRRCVEDRAKANAQHSDLDYAL
jgi:hypothetical protein